MTTPRRIQRRRAKGWRMPPDAIYVGRPGRFGNPFDWMSVGRDGATDFYRRWLAADLTPAERASTGVDLPTPAIAEAERERILRGIGALRGKDLACWCPLCEAHKDGRPLGMHCAACAPCHADVLLEIANT